MVTAERVGKGMTFFHLWRGAAVDEMAGRLYERLRVGTLA